MAVFQKIQKNSATALIVVGLGLFLFIFSDLFTSGSSLFAGNENYAGSIDGKEISLNEYESFRDNFMSFSNQKGNFASLSNYEKQNIANQSWEYMISNKLVNEECEANGIAVTEEEVKAMVAGEPQYLNGFFINMLYGDNYRNIRQKLVEDADNFLNYASVSPQRAEQVLAFGIRDKKQQKFYNLVKHSFFTTTSEAKDQYLRKQSTKDVTVTSIPYYLVPDSVIEVSDDEIRAFYEKNKGKYKRTLASKKIQFAGYAVGPSKSDEQTVLDEINAIKADFTTESNDAMFVRSESDGDFDEKYYKKGDGLPAELDNLLFDKEIGFIHGPYNGYNNGERTLNIAKVVDAKEIADSADISHIILNAEKEFQPYQNKAPDRKQMEAALKAFDARVDSIFKSLENGADFSSVAKAVSADTASAAKGGDEGWIQSNSTNFSKTVLDSIFLSDSKMPLRKIKIESARNLPYYRIVRINKMGERTKKLQVGIISKEVAALEQTRDSVYNQVRKIEIGLLDGKSIVELKDSMQYFVDSADVFPNQYAISDLKGARDLVYWAYNEAAIGKTKVFDFDKKLIVAQLMSETASGYTPWNDKEVKGEIENKVRKQKKAAYIAEKLNGVNLGDAGAITKIYPGVSSVEAKGVNAVAGVQQFSFEKSLTGAIAGMKAGTTSELVRGTDAIYVVTVGLAKDGELTDATNLDVEKGELSQATSTKVNYVISSMLKDKAEIEDNRKLLR